MALARLPVATLLATSLVVTAAACASDDGQGSLTFTTWGEDYIEKEIPAETFADGWQVTYTKFLVSLSEVSVAESDTAAPVAKMPRARIFDMHRPGVKPVFAASGIPAKPYPRVSYVVAPPTADAELAEGVPESDKQQLVSGGYGLWVEGTATKGATTKRFAWAFKAATVFDRCEGAIGGKTTPGVVVTNGGTDIAELTIHGDHLFYDDLQDPEAKVRFETIAAADANGDGEVTLEELAAVKLAAIPAERGPYGTGSVGGLNDLRAFVEALSRTVGHFRGEGECFAAPR